MFSSLSRSPALSLLAAHDCSCVVSALSRGGRGGSHTHTHRHTNREGGRREREGGASRRANRNAGKVSTTFCALHSVGAILAIFSFVFRSRSQHHVRSTEVDWSPNHFMKSTLVTLTSVKVIRNNGFRDTLCGAWLSQYMETPERVVDSVLP